MKPSLSQACQILVLLCANHVGWSPMGNGAHKDLWGSAFVTRAEWEAQTRFMGTWRRNVFPPELSGRSSYCAVECGLRMVCQEHRGHRSEWALPMSVSSVPSPPLSVHTSRIVKWMESESRSEWLLNSDRRSEHSSLWMAHKSCFWFKKCPAQSILIPNKTKNLSVFNSNLCKIR
jgi:hypothetical protein